MDLYFKFRFIAEVISIGIVVLVIISVGLAALWYKLSGYLKKRFGRKK